MKLKNCRSCYSKKLVKVFELGNQKFSGIFPNNINQKKVPSGNLSMIHCRKCSLLQLEETFDPNLMYGKNYGYMSSLNSSMLKHLYQKSYQHYFGLFSN